MRKKKTIKNLISTIILQIILIIGGLIVPKMIIKTYGSATNGLINSITLFLGYITLLQSGIGPVVKSLLYKPIANKEKSEIENVLYATEKFFRSIAYIFIFYVFLLCIFYPLFVSDNFNTIFTITLIVIISISVLAEYFFGLTYQVFLHANQDSYIINYIQAIAYILNAVTIILLMKMGLSVHIVKLASSLIFVIRPLFLSFYVKRRFNINYKNVDKNYKLKNQWDGLAQHIAAVVHGNTDVTLLTIFSNVVEVSVYTVYSNIISKFNNLISNITSSIESLFGDMLAKNEHDILNKTFSLYEYIYHSIVTIIYICIAILMIPFISIYTREISDANYIRPLFSILIIIAEFVSAMRFPYMSLTYAAGHFKQTMKCAIFETTINIVISIILIFKYGLVGVAIGTLVAMLIRTIEFIYHTSKYILKRSLIKSFSILIIIPIEFIIVEYIIHHYIVIKVTTYIEWIKYGFITGIIALIVVFIINTLVYKDDFKYLLDNINKRKKV